MASLLPAVSRRLAPFLGGITLSAAHIDVLMLQRPEAARRLFDEVHSKVPSLPTLPVTTYEMDALDDALRYMGGGTHVGKILISVGAVPAVQPLPRVDCSLEPDDSLARSVAHALGTSQATMVDTGRDAGRCVVLAGVPDAATDDDEVLAAALRGAEVVITRSRAVAWFATHRLGVPLAVEMQGTWGALAPSVVRQLMRGRGHVVARRPAFANARDTDAGWVSLLVSELVTSTVDPDTPFSSYGLDSLLLITLASRLTARVGRRVTSEELERLGTVRALQEAMTRGSESAAAVTAVVRARTSAHSTDGADRADRADGAATTEEARRRPRILCLHGYRSSAQVMELQLRPYKEALGGVAELVFIDAPQLSTGPQDPSIPDEVQTFEWYGERGSSFEEGWKREQQAADSTLDEVLRSIAARGPFDGVIGFSQGGAVASSVDARWGVFFSTITPPPAYPRVLWGRPTFHVFDHSEEYVELCEEMLASAAQAAPDITGKVMHGAGHNVPQDAASIESVAQFMRAQLAHGRAAADDRRGGSGHQSSPPSPQSDPSALP